MKTVGSWWVQNLLRPVLVAGMLVCLAAPLVMVMHQILPDLQIAHFLVFCFLASLEGILSERLLRKQHVTGPAYLGSRVAEAFVLVLLLKLTSYVPHRLDQLWADALRWQVDPVAFFDYTYWAATVLFLVLWMGSLYVARLLSLLDASEGKSAPPEDKTSVEYYLWLTSPPPVRAQQEGLEHLAEFFLWGGMALLVGAAAIHAFGISIKALALPILLYLAFGITLLSQGHFGVLHASWQGQGVPVQPGLVRRWLLWSLVFLVGVALAARLLPTQYAVGPVRTLLYLLAWLASILYQVVSFLFFMLMLLLAWLLLPFFPNIQPTPPPEPEPVEVPTVANLGAGEMSMFEFVITALFWIIILLIVVYVVYRFVSERLALLAQAQGDEGTWRGRLIVWLKGLWQRWQDWRRDVQAQLRQRRAARRERRAVRIPPFRYVSLRRLSPRQLIHYFYLSTERRAARAGQPRKAGQTPYEYRSDLDRRLPELEQDVEGLTNAFVEARYSPQPVAKGKADAVKPFWQRIKAALRRRKFSDSDDESG
jgi:hypothetical protein